MSAFNSPFEKLSYEAQDTMAKSLTPGGDVHDLLLDIFLQIRESNKRAEKAPSGGSIFSGITIKEAIALRVLGEKGLSAIADGLGKIADVIDGMSTSGKDAKDKMHALAEGISAFQGLGKAIFQFAGYLLLATPLLMIGVFAAPLFAASIYIIVKALVWATKPLTNKKTRKALTVLGDVAEAIWSFGWKIALSLLVYPFALAAMVLIVPTILLLGGLFYLMDKLNIEKSMFRISKALAFAGLAILALGVTLALFGMLFPPNEQSLKTLGIIGLAVLGTAFVFWLAGKMEKNIVKGALVMALVGLSLIVLGVGLFIISMATPDWEKIGMILAIIGGLGIVYGLAGAAASFIIPGAGAMLVVGISLIILGVGVMIFAKALENMTWEKVGMMGAIIGGLAIAMGLAGAASLFIIMGAGAMIAAGGALAIVALGVMAMSKVFEGSAWANMIATHHESDGFLGFGGGPVSNLQTLIEAIGYSFAWNPVTAAFIISGSVAMLAAAGAMVALVPGINAISKVFEGSAWKNMIATHHEDEGFLGFGGGPVSNIAYLISQLGAAFNMGFSSFGIIAGAGAMVTVGKSLISLSFGIKTFMKTGIQPGIAAQIGLMVSSIATPFGVIGKKYGGGTGFFGLGPSPLLTGVRAARGMGKALTSIAKGMVEMAKLRFPNYDDPSNPEKITSYTTLTGSAMSKVSANVMLMVLSLGTAFGKVGKMYPREPRGGLLGFYGFTKPSPVQQGISSMSGMGEVLTSIAGGMKDMAKLKFPIYGDPNNASKITDYVTLTGGNMAAVTSNIVFIIDSLADGFAQIGKKYPRKLRGGIAGLYGFTEKGPLGQGIAATSGMGEVIKTVAGGLLDMAKLKFPIYGDPNDPTKVTDYITVTKGDMGAVVSNIMFMIETIADAFADIGVKYGGWWFMDGPLAEGVEAMTEVGPVMTKILDPIKNFLKTEGVDMRQAPKDVSNLLTGMTTMFDKFAQIGSTDLYVVAMAMEKFFNSFKNEDYRFGNFLLAGKEKGQAAIQSITTMFERLASIKNIDQTAKYLSIIGKAVAGMRSEESSSFSSSSSDSGSTSKKGYGEVIALVTMLGMPAPALQANAQSLMMTSMAYQRIGTTLPMGGMALSVLGRTLAELDLGDTADSLESISKSYFMIAKASQEMEVEALKESTRMFEALAYLSEQGGEDAIEALGDELIEALKQLALMIADFEGTVADAKEENKSFVENVAGSVNKGMNKLFGYGSGGSTPTNNTSLPAPTSQAPQSNESMITELRLLNQNITQVLEELTV